MIVLVNKYNVNLSKFTKKVSLRQQVLLRFYSTVTQIQAINKRQNADSSSDPQSLKSRMLKKVIEMKLLGLAA